MKHEIPKLEGSTKHEARMTKEWRRGRAGLRAISRGVPRFDALKGQGHISLGQSGAADRLWSDAPGTNSEARNIQARRKQKARMTKQWRGWGPRRRRNECGGDVVVPLQGVSFLGDRVPWAARTGPGESSAGLRLSVRARSALPWADMWRPFQGGWIGRQSPAVRSVCRVRGRPDGRGLWRGRETLAQQRATRAQHGR